MLKEFRDFILRGNVLDLAVAVVIGAAFTAIVNSFVGDIIMPIIGVLIGGIDFSSLSITIGSAVISYGNFLQALINFLLIGLTHLPVDQDDQQTAETPGQTESRDAACACDARRYRAATGNP